MILNTITTVQMFSFASEPLKTIGFLNAVGNVLGKIIPILIAIFAFGVFIFVHELGHFLTAKKAGVKIHEFAIGMGPALFSFTKGETKYSLRLFPFGGYVSMEGEDEESSDDRSFGAKPAWKRAIILVAGAFMNLLLGFVLSLVITLIGDYIPTTTIAEFHEDAVTTQWLQVDDKIMKINGRNVKTADDIIFNIMQLEKGNATIEVLRNKEKVVLENIKFNTKYEEEIKQDMVVLDFYVYSNHKTFKTVMHQTFFGAISVVKMVWFSLLGLLGGVHSLESLSGPVGIIQVVGSSFSLKDLTPFLNILMMITINIGVFNLLPFPALDGGRVVFLIIEKIIGKKIPAKYEAIFNGAGLVILLGLMLIVTFGDIRKLIS